MTFQNTYCLISARRYLKAGAKTYRNEDIWNSPLILFPSLGVNLSASRSVSYRSMYDHRTEEKTVKPREGAFEARYQTPGDGEIDIACVMDLTGYAICIRVSQ